MADQLDDLTNDQLRLRLLEYGMANMPVTSTTRKVLIKKLRNVLDGGDKTPASAKSTRRETIAVARFSSGDDSDEPAAPARATPAQRKSKAPSAERSSGRRATVGVPAAPGASKSNAQEPTVVLAQLPLPPPSQAQQQQQQPQPKSITTRRSSGRITPSAIFDGVAARPSAPVSRAPAVVTLQEDSDDDIEFVPLARPAVAVSPGRPGRQSRSPSMGKSETIVTSFKQVLAPAPIAEAADESDTPTDTSGEAELRSFNIVGPAAGGSPLKSQSSKQYFSSSKSSSSTTTTTTTRTPYNPSTASPGRRMTTAPTTTWQLPATPARQTADADADDLIGTDVHTPYLSDFTRRLSRLRAEPLTVPIVSEATDGPSSAARRLPVRGMSIISPAPEDSEAYAYRTSMRVHGRQPTAVTADQKAAGNTLVQSVQRALGAFEQRFRYQIWAVVVLLLAVFLFTMVFA